MVIDACTALGEWTPPLGSLVYPDGGLILGVSRKLGGEHPLLGGGVNNSQQFFTHYLTVNGNVCVTIRRINFGRCGVILYGQRLGAMTVQLGNSVW